MRILCLTPWFPSHRQDQHGNYILDSVEALTQLGHEVVVLVTQPWRPIAAQLLNKEWVRRKNKLTYLPDGLNVYHCRYLSIPRYYCSNFTNWSYRNRVNPIVERLLRKYQCQLIHAHTELAAVSAVDIGRKHNVPVVTTLHGISTEKKLYLGKQKKLLYNYALSQSNRIILVGNPLIHFFSKLINHADFRVVHNGFRNSSNNLIDNNNKWQEEKLRIISVSNLVEGKGIEINLQALSRLCELGIKNWEYKIIGDGPERNNLEQLADKLDINKHVHFMGACQHDKVYDYLNQAEVFSLPSYREAFGIAYVEAMSCGLLTIGVKEQGPQAFIDNEKTGFLVSPNKIDSLVNIFKTIFENKLKMREIAEAGKKHVHNEFTWKKHAERLTAVYQELLHE